MKDIVTDIGIDTFTKGVKLAEEGKSWHAIAVALGITDSQAKRLKARATNISDGRIPSNAFLIDLVDSCIANNPKTTITQVADVLNITTDTAKKLVDAILEASSDTRLIKKLAIQAFSDKKAITRLRDKNRINNKVIRSEVRFTNAIEELLTELNTQLKTTVFSEIPKNRIKVKDSKGVGLVQLADLHLNEVVDLIDTLNYNTFNYDIACKRLKKFFNEIVLNLKARKITSVVVANSGDILNSDRRLDELLTNAGTRSIALIVAVDILSQFLRDLDSNFNVTYATVLGNESRKYDELTWSNKSFSNNYDFDVHYMLQALLEDKTNIEFVPINNSYEMLLDLAGKKFLVLHGIKIGNDPNNWINKTYAKYAQTGIVLDYVIFGHIHETLNSDRYARSGSLIGTNSYANNALNKTGRASQNLYIIQDNSIITIAVDLQDPGEDSYTHCKFEELSGQRKSREKAEDKRPYFSVTI